MANFLENVVQYFWSSVFTMDLLYLCMYSYTTANKESSNEV